MRVGLEPNIAEQPAQQRAVNRVGPARVDGGDGAGRLNLRHDAIMKYRSARPRAGTVARMSEPRQAGPWRVLASREVYRNPWLRLREDDTIDPNGRPSRYAVV